MKLIFILLCTVLELGCVISELPRANHYDEEYFKFPKKCPANTTGSPPECLCAEGKAEGLFNAYKNRCEICRTGTSGTYPECICEDKELEFSAYLATLDYKNGCYAPCPENSVGIHPQCKCDEFHLGYLESERKCHIRECPERSTGISPNCVCKENYIFYTAYWECIYQRPGSRPPVFLPPVDLYCPERNGKYPQCAVLIGIGVVKSLIG